MDNESDQQTRDRAYQLWLDEGQPEGKADAHWYQAEREASGDRAAIAAETDYVMQVDEGSRSATQAQLSNPGGPSDPMSGSVAPQRSDAGPENSKDDITRD